MKNIGMTWLILLSIGIFPRLGLGNQIYNRAVGFDVQQSQIAFLGSYYSPLKIWGNGSDKTYLIPHDNNPFDPPFFVAEESQAVNETNQSIQDIAAEMNLPLVSMPFDKLYQSVLLKHVLSPQKYLYNTQISKYCGDRPYILAVIVDYYAEFSRSLHIREKEKGQKIDYLGKRSILEEDFNMFQLQGRQEGVALEFILISAKDGSTLWHGNLVTTGNALLTNYAGIAKGLARDAFKNLMKK